LVRLFKRRKSGDDASSRTSRMFRQIQMLGGDPSHIVDIGANHGNWSRGALAAFPNAKLTAFEPQRHLAEKHADLAADPRVTLHYKGVGDFDGSATFTLHPRDDSSSFIYDAEQAQEMGFEQTEVEIVRLDTVMAGSPFGPPDLVKIDAEGLDLKVLEGGADTVAQAQVVLVEATVACPEYPNTAAIIFQKMDDLGFRLFDITDLNRTPEQDVLWLIEATFVRKGSAIEAASRHYK
jgi:FkbM family methyltransferase